MKDLAKLLLYLASLLVLGALAAPPLYWTAQTLVATGRMSDLFNYDFETYFHRALLIAAVLLLWPLLRTLRVRSWHDLALEKNPRPARDVVVGFLIATIPVVCCGAVLLALKIYSPRQTVLWAKVPAVLVAALAVPVIEEMFFRGLILGVLQRSLRRGTALVITSLFFSVVHFLKAPDTAAGPVTWFSGFVSIGNSFGQFSDPVVVMYGFVTLFVIGCILADVRLATRSLWMPIGLHAGWIFAKGMFSKIAHREMIALPWIGKDLLAGIVPLMLALASWAVVRGWLRHADGRAAQSSRGTR